MVCDTPAAAPVREDRYPSRGCAPELILPRRDPVIYADDPGAGPIDAAQVEQYRERGFMVLDGVFDGAEIGRLQQELEALSGDSEVLQSEEAITEPDSGALRSLFRVHTSSAVFSRLATDARLVGLAQYLLGDDVYVHQSRLNYKPGFRGREFYWHSDFETWHVEDGMPGMRALSMSITLTPNHPWNGPLLIIPGSHRHYVACEGETPADHFRSSLKQQRYGVPSDQALRRLVEHGGIEAATGAPGSVIVFDCNAMHGSNGNITPFPRSNVFLVYNALSNRVGAPFCRQPPRPDFLCSRRDIGALSSGAGRVA